MSREQTEALDELRIVVLDDLAEHALMGTTETPGHHQEVSTILVRARQLLDQLDLLAARDR